MNSVIQEICEMKVEEKPNLAECRGEINGVF